MQRRTQRDQSRTSGRGDAKVDELPRLRLHHHEHVLGLDVAVHVAEAVQARELRREVCEHREDAVKLAARREPRRERQATLLQAAQVAQFAQSAMRGLRPGDAVKLHSGSELTPVQ